MAGDSIDSTSYKFSNNSENYIDRDTNSLKSKSEDCFSLLKASSIYGTIKTVYPNVEEKTVKLVIENDTSKRILIFDTNSELLTNLLDYYKIDELNKLEGKRILRDGNLYKIPTSLSVFTKIKYKVEFYLRSIKAGTDYINTRFRLYLVTIDILNLILFTPIGLYFELNNNIESSTAIQYTIIVYSCIRLLFIGFTMSMPIDLTKEFTESIRSYRYTE